jgi:FemAB-related protein (PEP-CTERM system-associated)
MALRGGAVVGVLPLMLCRTPFGGANLLSSPYGVYGGPLAVDDGVRARLLEAALEEARSQGVGRLELRSREPLEHPGLTHSDLYVTFVKDLPRDPEEVLGSMKKDERRLVRRAADTHGLELDEGPWFVEELARLFQSSKQRLGSPGLPVAWFRALLAELGEEAVIHLVRRQREVVAASMCFIDGDALRMYYIGTTPEANRDFAATSFLIAELQRWAVERGLARFDLGRSRRDAGAVKFKTNQGFTAAPLHYAYGLVRSSSLPSFTPSNPRTAVLRRTWAQLPAWLCTRLSARLSRFLP